MSCQSDRIPREEKGGGGERDFRFSTRRNTLERRGRRRGPARLRG